MSETHLLLKVDAMNKKEIKAQVHALIEAGTPKSEVFSRLSGQGIKDSQLAYFIAAYPHPQRREQHKRKVNLLVMAMLLYALMAFLVGFAIGSQIGPTGRWVLAVVVAAIPLLFAWGFRNYKVAAYNVYILLSLIHLPRAFDGFMAQPLANSIALSVNFGMIAFVWYVRHKLFPDFLFITPAKVKGEYHFQP
jgi:cation transport ATPase